jgi:hypothetical protein
MESANGCVSRHVLVVVIIIITTTTTFMCFDLA